MAATEGAGQGRVSRRLMLLQLGLDIAAMRGLKSFFLISNRGCAS